METKYKELKLAFYECKDGTLEYKIARTELIHFERELIAKVLSGDKSFSHTIRELPATYLEVATDTHYSSEKDIQEFREDIINWFSWPRVSLDLQKLLKKALPVVNMATDWNIATSNFPAC